MNVNKFTKIAKRKIIPANKTKKKIIKQLQEKKKRKKKIQSPK